MKKLITLMLPLMALLMFSFQTSAAGEQVDADNDGLFCIEEDDATYCNEDDQDKCDGIPNVSRDDDNCSVDLNGDGYFTQDDLHMIVGMYPGSNGDHLLLGDYNIFNAYYNRDYDFYGQFGIPIPVYDPRFGGHICFFPMRVIEYNNRLIAAGLPLLQTKPDGTVDFNVIQQDPSGGCSAVHHSYPAIR